MISMKKKFTLIRCVFERENELNWKDVEYLRNEIFFVVENTQVVRCCEGCVNWVTDNVKKEELQFVDSFIMKETLRKKKVWNSDMIR